MNRKETLKQWRKRILVTIWITYASFYLCRVNMSIATPAIMEEYGFSKTEMGMILSALFFAYAAGQFINGQLGDKFGARRLVSLGIVMSAALNFFFGFSNTLTAMLLLWGLNGYFQSMGWSPTVKTLANWFPPQTRGRMGGLVGSSYIAGNAISWALAGFVVGLLGWRWAFWIPAAVLVLAAIHYLIRIKNAPEEVGLPSIEAEANGAGTSEIRTDEYLGLGYMAKHVLKNPALWYIAFALFWLNVVRYGFMAWAPTYMFEVQGATISQAAYKAVAMPVAGISGALFGGWVTDRFFKSNAAPIAVVMLALLGVCAWLYPRIPAEDWVLSLICLMAIGFVTYGPHVLIVATLPACWATRKATAAAVGFIDGFGYIGASLVGVSSGWLIDNFSWNAAFYLWAISAIIAAAFLLPLLRRKPSIGEFY